MADVRVTKQFKENFDLWAEHVLAEKTWTPEDLDGFKQLMREYELADGPDRLRDTLVHYTPDGQEHPSAIDNPKERYAYWDRYFATQAAEIRRLHLMSAGITDRIREDRAHRERKAA